MILSVSRRTDIPCYYAEWFFNRIRAGYVLTRNPMNHAQLYRVPLSPDIVDCVVFWTKDAQNILPCLDTLDELGYRYYFQFTLTPYGHDLEPGLRDKAAILETFCTLSEKLGPERVLWRYDPIVLNETYDITYHKGYFRQMCRILAPYTRRVTVSFVDLYPKLRTKMIRPITTAEIETISLYLRDTAQTYGLDLCACSEVRELASFGIRPAACIDRELISSICGEPLNIPRDPNQRPDCGCVSSIDIGAYDTCLNGCVYCYANHGTAAAQRRHAQHDPKSPLLFGTVQEGETIRTRQVQSYRKQQMSWFD